MDAGEETVALALEPSEKASMAGGAVADAVAPSFGDK